MGNEASTVDAAASGESRSPQTRETEAAFMEAARKIFAAQGYRNARIVDIAAAAGRSPGSFYNYWESKEALLRALISFFPQSLLTQLRSRPRSSRSDRRENAHHVVSVYWRTYRDWLPEIIGIVELSATDEAFQSLWQRNRSIGVDLVAREVRSAQRRGHVQGKRPEVLASAIVSMLDGFFWTWLVRDGEVGVRLPSDGEVIDILGDVFYRAIYDD